MSDENKENVNSIYNKYSVDFYADKECGLDESSNEKCDFCKMREEIIEDFTNSVLMNEITLNKALMALSMMFYESGYKDSLIDDLEEKSELLTMLDEGVEDEEED